MESLSQSLALASGLVLMIAYAVYNWSVLFGKEARSVATWAIWAAIVLLSTSSYTIASGDWWMATIALVNSVLCITTFVVVAVKGEFKVADPYDKAALCLGISAAITWAIFRSATYANLIVQIAIVIGFVPTWRGVWRRTVQERSLPWWLWSFAYILALVVVIMRWNGNRVALVYPINCIWLHASVSVIVGIRKRMMTPEQMKDELEYLRRQISNVERENALTTGLNDRIATSAVDAGTIHFERRVAGRQSFVDHNEALLSDLRLQEARLKKKLGIS